MLFVGVDLVKIERWERILEKFPARAEKIFTPDEIAHCEKKGKKRAESYAALCGAHEANWDQRNREKQDIPGGGAPSPGNPHDETAGLRR